MKSRTLIPRQEGVLSRHILSRPLAPAPKPKPEPQPPPVPPDTVPVPCAIFDRLMLASITELLTTMPDVATPSKAMIELAKYLSLDVLNGTIVLVCEYLDSETETQGTGREMSDIWLGVLERLQQIRDERA